MIYRYAYSGGVWVDLEHPSDEEVHQVAHEFGISERLESEILTPTPTPLIAADEGTSFLALHFPAHEEESGAIRDQEIDFIVGKHYIITARYEVVVSLHHLKKALEAEHLLSPEEIVSTDVLLEILFVHLYTAVRDHTAHISAHLPHIERDMFNGKERETIRHISASIREVLHIESSLAAQEEPLRHFLKDPTFSEWFGESFSERATRILSEYAHVTHHVRTYHAITTELRATNAALLETRQNEIMRTLTLITVIVLPLELIAFIFGMHLPGTPLEQEPHAFWIILAIMIGISGLLLLYFLRRRWLS